ncbi:unnamed protein product [Cylindrotheca closterium]|uniref:Uncharacterized protein n=1 Tax=Cylindrotheca closterium TaxID=2856 RepID=A0AAD2G9I8_9STRA|nr:unnamed protein product [Cylindrotheca closterium]
MIRGSHLKVHRLVAALLEGRFRVIGDGSFKNELGTAAVQLLVKHRGSDRIIIRCQTPGLPHDQSPYRSELIGLMAGIMAIDWLLQQWAPNLLTRPRVWIACDGLSAIEMALLCLHYIPSSGHIASGQLGPSIKHAILQLLHGVRAPSSPSLRTIPPLVRPTFLAQQVIGYQGLLEGHKASSWLPLQQQHYDEIRCRRSVSLWASRLSQQLILIGFYMWEQWNSVQHLDDNVQLHERHSTINEGIHSQFDMVPMTCLGKFDQC